MKFPFFFYFCRSFLPSWIRIRNTLYRYLSNLSSTGYYRDSHIPELGPPLCDEDGGAQVDGHGDQDHQTEVDIERHAKVDDGNEDVHKGGEDAEDQVLEQGVDGVGAAVHHAQHLARLPAQVPAQAEAVQVAEQRHLDLQAGELLHPDPEEVAPIV
jgi:hypothetical protein